MSLQSIDTFAQGAASVLSIIKTVMVQAGWEVAFEYTTGNTPWMVVTSTGEKNTDENVVLFTTTVNNGVGMSVASRWVGWQGNPLTLGGSVTMTSTSNVGYISDATVDFTTVVAVDDVFWVHNTPTGGTDPSLRGPFQVTAVSATRLDFTGASNTYWSVNSTKSLAGALLYKGTPTVRLSGNVSSSGNVLGYNSFSRLRIACNKDYVYIDQGSRVYGFYAGCIQPFNEIDALTVTSTANVSAGFNVEIPVTGTDIFLLGQSYTIVSDNNVELVTIKNITPTSIVVSSCLYDHPSGARIGTDPSRMLVTTSAALNTTSGFFRGTVYCTVDELCGMVDGLEKDGWGGSSITLASIDVNMVNYFTISRQSRYIGFPVYLYSVLASTTLLRGSLPGVLRFGGTSIQVYPTPEIRDGSNVYWMIGCGSAANFAWYGIKIAE